MPKNKFDLKSVLLGSVPFAFQLLLLALAAYLFVNRVEWRVTQAEEDIRGIEIIIDNALVPRTEFNYLKQAVERIDGNVQTLYDHFIGQ